MLSGQEVTTLSPDVVTTMDMEGAPLLAAGHPLNGFVAALFVILASELGDKTFIITTIMAMKYSRKSVFLGALTAATLMITLSGNFKAH